MITKKVLQRYEVLPDFSGCLVAGVDEAGRGALAGPVIAGAAILPDKQPIEACMDSKKLSPATRTEVAKVIKKRALAWAIGSASCEEIDDLNILNASLLAMQRAVEGLAVTPDLALIDGNHLPSISLSAQAIIGGDDRVEVISAASILAKTTRDQLMLDLHEHYPVYNFAQHKGYPTKEHLHLIDQYGICEHHRKSYRPIKQRTLFSA